LTTSGYSNQGEGSGARGFGGDTGGALGWLQHGLFPTTMLHARLDLGWHAGDRIGTWAIEVRNPVDGALLAEEVHPLQSYPDILGLLIRSTSQQRVILLELLDPDPFR
jgi:hypothetical protein